LFSILFRGSEANGDWNDADWQRYYAAPKDYWSGKVSMPNAGTLGLDRFVGHLSRLAQYYSAGEEDMYVQAIGFIWGGMPLWDPVSTAWKMATDPNGAGAWADYEPLIEGTAGWKPELVDTDTNPSHHYAGFLYMGYFFGSAAAYASNWLRDGPLSNTNDPDLKLGYLSANHGAMLGNHSIGMGQVWMVAYLGLSLRVR
jgi:hypothetical protein